MIAKAGRFYEDCEEIFGGQQILGTDLQKNTQLRKRDKLERIVSYLNYYFNTYPEVSIFLDKQSETDVICFKIDDNLDMLNGFLNLKELLKKAILSGFPSLSDAEVEHRITELTYSVIGSTYINPNAHKHIVPKFREALKNETKSILRRERVEVLGEELIEKYGEDKIIEAEKFFEKMDLSYTEVNISGKDLLYKIMKKADFIIDLEKLCSKDSSFFVGLNLSGVGRKDFISLLPKK